MNCSNKYNSLFEVLADWWAKKRIAKCVQFHLQLLFPPNELLRFIFKNMKILYFSVSLIKKHLSNQSSEVDFAEQQQKIESKMKQFPFSYIAISTFNFHRHGRNVK